VPKKLTATTRGARMMDDRSDVTVHPFSQAQLRCGLFHSISAWSSRAAPDAESVML
jgi:hypothetical protein